MAVNANDIIKARWLANNTSPSTAVVQDFYWQLPDPGNGNEVDIAADLANHLLAIWANVQASLTVDYIADKIKFTNETQRKLMPEVNAPFQGTDAGDDLPGAVAMLALARTGFLGQQGRKYVGPIAVSAQVEGVLTVAARNGLNTFAQSWSSQFVGPVSAAVCDPGVAKYPGNLQPPTFTKFDPTLYGEMGRTRTMRSRREGVGI